MKELTFITPKDFYIFGKDLAEALKKYFPFEGISFLVGTSDDLKSLLSKVSLSERQRQRALLSLRDKEPFWDRVQHQVFIPLNCLRQPFLPIAHLKGVPKNIGAEETKWFTKLISFFLVKNLSELKYIALNGENRDLPDYLYRFFNYSKKPDNVLIFLQLGNINLDYSELVDIFSSFFNREEFELLAMANNSYWFLFHSLINYDIIDSFKKTAIFFSKKYPLKNLYFFKVDEIDKFKKSFSLASALKARIFSSFFIEKIFNETGVDLLKLISIETKGINTYGLFKFSSSKKEALIKNYLLSKGVFLMPVGEKIFICGFSKKDSFNKNSYLDKSKKIYLSLKELDSELIAGFSSIFQSGITKTNILAYTFISFYHAFLLGKGSYAIFDALSSNVHGDLLYSLGDIKGAITAYKQGLRLKGNDVNLLNSLGTLYAELGLLSKAENVFLKALAIEPQNIMGLYNLSGIYLRKRKFDNALEVIEKALDIEPNNLALLVRKLEILLDNEDFNGAYTFSKKIITQNIKRPSYLSFLCAQALIFKKEWDKAKEILKEILKKNPSYYMAFLFLAYGFLKFEKDKNTASRFIKDIDIKKIKNKRYQKVLNEVLEEINGVY